MEEEVKAVDVKDIAAEEMGKKLLESMIGVVQSIKRPWNEMTQSNDSSGNFSGGTTACRNSTSGRASSSGAGTCLSRVTNRRAWGATTSIP